MKSKEKFFRACAVLLTYLLASTALLKWVASPRLPARIGNALVVANVALMLAIWIVLFFKWGPLHGNWTDADPSSPNP